MPVATSNELLCEALTRITDRVVVNESKDGQRPFHGTCVSVVMWYAPEPSSYDILQMLHYVIPPWKLPILYSEHLM